MSGTEAKTPRPTPLGESEQSSSLVWRAVPPSTPAARDVVRRFFDVVARESTAELQALMVEDALFHRPNQPATPADLAWTRRFSMGDYSHQVNDADLSVYVFSHAAYRQLYAHRNSHLAPDADELLAVVKMPATSPSSTPLWGTEMEVVLQFQGGQWQIKALWEDYQLK